MSPSHETPNRTRHPLRTLAAIALPLLLASGLLVAHAASIGLASKKLAAYTVTGAPTVPTVYAWTNFTGTTGASIASTPLPSGQNWTIHIGTWTFNANQAAPSNTALANASVSVGTTSAAVQADMTFTTTARRAGLTFLDDSNDGLYALVSNQTGGQVQLYKQVGGTGTLLGTATGLGTPGSATLRIEAFTNVIKVYFAGNLVLTYTLTAAESTLFKGAGHTRFGIIADSDSATRFDNFRVESA